MSWRDVRVLYLRELRAALRQRTIVVNSILVPIFLYPVMLWLMMTGISFVAGWSESFEIRVALSGLPDGHGRLVRWLERGERMRLVEEVVPGEAAERIRQGDLDAYLEFAPATGEAAAVAGNFTARLLYDGSRDRSAEARGRLSETLLDYRADWLERQGEAYGLSGAEWAQFEIERHNVATGEEMGAFVLGLMLPLFLVIMVAVGCFHPAIDATAGEHERGTWETLMTVGAARSSVVAAKYLYVASLGAIAGLLNLVAMTLSSRAIFAPLLSGGEALSFEFPLRALPVAAAGAVVLALFAAAGMMLLASFARTFKEGQSMITPFYLLLFLPVILLQQPDLEFTPLLSAIPVANVMLMIREAISGRFDPMLIAVTLAVGLALVAASIRLATLVLRYEEVVVGTYSGSLGRFLRERWKEKR